jgi:putative peptidoglycan lipid II flippase
MLFKSGLIFSSLTAVSRVFGLARDVLIAILLGVSPGTDVFFVALSFSQMLRGLALEGPVLQTMVATFSRHALEGSMTLARHVAARLAGLVALVSSVLILFFLIFPQVLVALIGSGFLFDPERSELARNWLPLAFLYMLPIGLVGIMVALQNSANHFASTAITPIIFNICIIIALLIGAEEFSAGAGLPLVLLSIPIAGVIQYGFHLWRSANSGLSHRPLLALNDKNLRALLILLVPALGTLFITQASTLSNNIIGSFLPVGSLSWINYANRVAILPVGIIGIALVTVFVPAMAKAHASAATGTFDSLLKSGVRTLLLIGAPATVGVCMLAEPIAFSLFQYGNLDVHHAHRISLALMILALNIPASMLSSLFVAVFFVRRQPQIALRVAIWLLAIGIIVKLLFVSIFDTDSAYLGLALGISVASWINVALLWIALRRNGIRLHMHAVSYLSMARVLIALALMAGALVLSGNVDWHGGSLVARMSHLFADCAGGALIYLSTLWLLGERMPAELMRRA